jgi:hypothetical protein
MKKCKKHAFGKDIYLLGADEYGTNYWLEAPKWDCGWYWGFGYVETYTNNKSPETSEDISSHSHAKDFLSKYFMVWNNSKPILTKQVFNEKEGWELSELFEQFYFLKQAAEMFKDGKANCATADVPLWRKPELVTEINEKLIPQITSRILKILSPTV